MLRSLQGDRAFQRLRKGRSGGSKHLSVRLRPARHGQVRLGVVVSRKVGKAVVRNRVRRRLREAMLALLRARGGDEHERDEREQLSVGPEALAPRQSAPRHPAWPSSFDLLVLTRPSAAEADYHELARALERAVDRAVSGTPRPPGSDGSSPKRRGTPTAAQTAAA